MEPSMRTLPIWVTCNCTWDDLGHFFVNIRLVSNTMHAGWGFMHRLVRGISAKRRCFNPDLFELNLDLNFNVNVISQSKFASKAKVGRPSTGVSFYAPKIKPQETFLTVDEQLLPLVRFCNSECDYGSGPGYSRFSFQHQCQSTIELRHFKFTVNVKVRFQSEIYSYS